MQPVADGRRHQPTEGDAADSRPPSAAVWQGEAQRRSSPFLPLLILMLSVGVWTAFQTWQLSRESTTLATLRANQQAQLDQAQKVRQTLDQLASETQKLADAGNANARLVIEELRKRGITINRPQPGAAEAGKTHPGAAEAEKK